MTTAYPIIVRFVKRERRKREALGIAVEKVSELIVKELKKYVELCRERGIELFLFELPVVAYWSWLSL